MALISVKIVEESVMEHLLQCSPQLKPRSSGGLCSQLLSSWSVLLLIFIKCDCASVGFPFMWSFLTNIITCKSVSKNTSKFKQDLLIGHASEEVTMFR